MEEVGWLDATEYQIILYPNNSGMSMNQGDP